MKLWVLVDRRKPDEVGTRIVSCQNAASLPAASYDERG